MNWLAIAALAADLGEITSGHLKNSGNTAAIRLSGTTALPSTNYIDFTATGSQSFIKHAGIDARANGDLHVKAVKILGAGGTPTITPHAGYDGLTSITGTDTAGYIDLGISTGSPPAGVQTSVTFSTAYATTPFVVVCSGDSSSALALTYVINVSTTGFDIATRNAVTGSNSRWRYLVIA